MEKIQFTVTEAQGLHARPATTLVSSAAAFTSTININYADKTANIKSILAVMSLGVPTNAQVEIEISGDDEVAAKEKLMNVITELQLGKIN